MQTVDADKDIPLERQIQNLGNRISGLKYWISLMVACEHNTHGQSELLLLMLETLFYLKRQRTT